jgi:hypothetical protein
VSTLAPFGSVVDGDALLEVLWSALAAGIGVTAVFGVAIYGFTRAVDLGRDGRTPEAAVVGALGLIALALVAAALVFGIVVMTNK